METFESIVFILVLASCALLGLTDIWQSKEISKLKERLRNENESTCNIWRRTLSNNLPIFFDNQHGKETKGKKSPFDFAEATKFEAKEQMYVEKIRKLEKILADEEIKLSVYGQVANMKADKLKYEKFELNLEKSLLQNEVERLNSLLELKERKYINLLDFVIYKTKNGITTVDIDFKKTREKIEELIEESNKKSK